MPMQTQIGKWSNALPVRISDAYARDLQPTEGMEMEVTLVDEGLLVCPSRQQSTLEELVVRITPENLYGETEWGPAVGR
jgi:antitoxin MazE